MKASWDQAWRELRDCLMRQPRCPEHPEYPCIHTLDRPVTNDVVQVNEDGVGIRSHKTTNYRFIPVGNFRSLWSHLEEQGGIDTSVTPHGAVMRAILVGCFPERVVHIGGQRLRFVEIAPYRPAPQAEDLAAPPAGRVEITVSRIIRDTQLASRVMALHNYKCQICGYTIVFADGSRYAEGHHVRPLGSPHDGPDVLENIVCLCPNHHAACDLGAIRLEQADLRHAPGHAVAQQYIDYHNQTIYRGN